MEDKPKKYEKYKGQTPEEIKATRKKYREKYIEKFGGIEKYRTMVAKASLICYHKAKANGTLKIRPRKEFTHKRDNLLYFKKSDLVDKIRELENKMNNI